MYTLLQTYTAARVKDTGFSVPPGRQQEAEHHHNDRCHGEGSSHMTGSSALVHFVDKSFFRTCDHIGRNT